jgi:hypothetical protein
MAELVRISPEGISQHATASSLDVFLRMPFVANSSLVKQGHESPKIPGNPDGDLNADLHTNDAPFTSTTTPKKSRIQNN